MGHGSHLSPDLQNSVQETGQDNSALHNSSSNIGSAISIRMGEDYTVDVDARPSRVDFHLLSRSMSVEIGRAGILELPRQACIPLNRAANSRLSQSVSVSV